MQDGDSGLDDEDYDRGDDGDDSDKKVCARQ
jgi:hypothetical protein